MTHLSPALAFDCGHLAPLLDALDDAALDTLDFGVIGFDADGIVRRYSTVESRLAGLPPQRVVGLHLFGVVAQCMNNYLVAQRFEDAAAEGVALDATIDFVLTLRVRPVRVQLRLLAESGQALRYVAIKRLP
jgi:photoactive yellow protein